MASAQTSSFHRLNTWVEEHLTKVSFVEKIFFVSHLKTMIRAGISLVEALQILGKQSENARMKKMVGEIGTRVEKGQTLSDVLRDYPVVFPPIYVSMVASGEASGQLEQSLEQIETQMTKSQALISSIRGAMIYPCVVLCAMAGIGVMMVTVVLPKLIVIFKDFDSELPLATRILIVITNFMSNPINLVILVAVIGGSTTAFVMLLKKQPPFKKLIHTLNLHLPIVGGVIKEVNLAQFSLTLSSLLKSALPITEAIRITGETCTNVLYREALTEANEKVTTGVPLSETLRKYDNLFPPIVTEMIMVGERSGEVETLLHELAEFYSANVDKTMKNFSTIIEPVIILALGVAVGGMAVAVIMPMYSLVQSF